MAETSTIKNQNYYHNNYNKTVQFITHIVNLQSVGACGGLHLGAQQPADGVFSHGQIHQQFSILMNLHTDVNGCITLPLIIRAI